MRVDPDDREHPQVEWERLVLYGETEEIYPPHTRWTILTYLRGLEQMRMFVLPQLSVVFDSRQRRIVRPGEPSRK